MVDLTPEPGPLTVSKAPTPGVSPQQIAQPYAEFAHALDQSGEALGEVAKNAAEQAGYKAVTRDADGNIQIEKAPILGPASVAYSRAVKFAALAEGEAQLKQKDIALRTQYRDDPEGYLKAADAFKTDVVKRYSDAGGPDLGITLGKGIDATTTQTYRGLLNESERLALQRADKSITAQVESTKDDAFALARGGDTSSPAFMQAMDKISTLTQERVNNPRFAYPPEAAKYDLDNFHDQLKGNAFLHNTDQVYKDKGVNDDGTAKGGAANALEYAKSILSDPTLKLTPEQRNAFYSKAVGEIHANEAIRRQDIGEARAAASSLSMTSALGGKIDPADVESVAQAFRAAGAPGEAAKLYATYARKPLNDDFGRQGIEPMTQQLNSLRQGGALATSPGEARLIQHESGGNTGLVNKLGYAGTYQFGAPLLKDIGIYTPGAGENTNDRSAPGQWSGQKWSGTFNVPGFPEVKTLRDFLANPAAQKAAFDLHTANMDAQISANGMDRFIGTNVGGVPITRDGLHAMIHLGGAAGTMQTLASGGAVNPRDANGTSLLDYARMGATAGVPNPASTMWLQANHTTVLQKAARDNWTSIVSDYDKTGQRPSDDTLNQVVNAARATNDHSLLEGVGQFVDRMDTAQRQSQQPLAQQEADITRGQAAGNTGQLSPGQSGVLKDLQRRYGAITKGLDENPISTTVQNFPDRFHTPAPINVQDPQQLAVGLGQRAQIAQFAQQNWGGPSRSALDKADLAQVTAALDTPDPKVKGQIFAAIATLPQAVRDATLSKIGEKRPDFMVSAAAGGLMQEAPDVAQSILRGQEALGVKEGNGTNARSAYAVQSAQDWNDQLKKDTVLPPTAFSLQARSNPSGGYEVARDMIRARYADISAQKGDTSGKIDADRVKQAADDVTGGILYHNGAPLVAPQRGMAQTNFDILLSGVNDNDLAGVTTLNGAPVTSDYLKGTAQLESFGAGRYLVRLGADPMRPIYAFTGANSETPQKFVLDLRNRAVGPVAISGFALNQSAGYGP